MPLVDRAVRQKEQIDAFLCQDIAEITHCRRVLDGVGRRCWPPTTFLTRCRHEALPLRSRDACSGSGGPRRKRPASLWPTPTSRRQRAMDGSPGGAGPLRWRSFSAQGHQDHDDRSGETGPRSERVPRPVIGGPARRRRRHRGSRRPATPTGRRRPSWWPPWSASTSAAGPNGAPRQQRPRWPPSTSRPSPDGWPTPRRPTSRRDVGSAGVTAIDASSMVARMQALGSELSSLGPASSSRPPVGRFRQRPGQRQRGADRRRPIRAAARPPATAVRCRAARPPRPRLPRAQRRRSARPAAGAGPRA